MATLKAVTQAAMDRLGFTVEKVDMVILRDEPYVIEWDDFLAFADFELEGLQDPKNLLPSLIIHGYGGPERTVTGYDDECGEEYTYTKTSYQLHFNGREWRHVEPSQFYAGAVNGEYTFEFIIQEQDGQRVLTLQDNVVTIGATHLLNRILRLIEQQNGSVEDVRWVGTIDGEYSMSWAEFESIANFNYRVTPYWENPEDNPAFHRLIIVGSNWYVMMSYHRNVIPPLQPNARKFKFQTSKWVEYKGEIYARSDLEIVPADE